MNARAHGVLFRIRHRGGTSGEKWGGATRTSVLDAAVSEEASAVALGTMARRTEVERAALRLALAETLAETRTGALAAMMEADMIPTWSSLCA